jgi:hypothetical protein
MSETIQIIDIQNGDIGTQETATGDEIPIKPTVESDAPVEEKPKPKTRAKPKAKLEKTEEIKTDEVKPKKPRSKSKPKVEKTEEDKSDDIKSDEVKTVEEKPKKPRAKPKAKVDKSEDKSEDKTEDKKEDKSEDKTEDKSDDKTEDKTEEIKTEKPKKSRAKPKSQPKEKTPNNNNAVGTGCEFVGSQEADQCLTQELSSDETQAAKVVDKPVINESVGVNSDLSTENTEKKTVDEGQQQKKPKKTPPSRQKMKEIDNCSLCDKQATKKTLKYKHPDKCPVINNRIIPKVENNVLNHIKEANNINKNEIIDEIKNIIPKSEEPINKEEIIKQIKQELEAKKEKVSINKIELPDRFKRLYREHPEISENNKINRNKYANLYNN